MGDLEVGDSFSATSIRPLGSDTWWKTVKVFSSHGSGARCCTSLRLRLFMSLAQPLGFLFTLFSLKSVTSKRQVNNVQVPNSVLQKDKRTAKDLLNHGLNIF